MSQAYGEREKDKHDAITLSTDASGQPFPPGQVVVPLETGHGTSR
jgi:hypothetical protein